MRVGSGIKGAAFAALVLILGPAKAPGDELPRAIGIVDFYGLRTLSEAQVRQALQVKEGDSLPASDEAVHLKVQEITRRLEALPNVAEARLEFVCCESGKLILYVGIEEKGTQSLQFNPAPQGSVRLPPEIVTAGEGFDKAFVEAAEKQDFAEDDSNGYTLMHYPAARAAQERFVPLAKQYLTQLRDVLRNSSDSDQRQLAAQVVAYAPDKRSVIPDLVAAVKDPDGGVRNNATRALWVMARYAQQHPELHLEIPINPFVQMLNSIEWTDRNKSSAVLASLTESRNPLILSELRKQALPSLVEMARWKAAGHAQPAFFILGRLDGLSEKQIGDDWDYDREAVISAAVKKQAN